MGKPAPRSVEVRVRPLTTLFFGAASFVLLLYFWHELTSLLLILLGATVLAASVIPLVDRMPGPRWLSGLAIGVSYVLSIFAALTLAGWLVGDAIRSEMEHWPEISATIEHMLTEQLRGLGLDVEVELDVLIARARAWLIPDGDIEAWVSLSREIGSLLLTLALLTFGTIYMLIQPRGQIANYLALLLPRAERHRVHGTFNHAEPRLRWWLFGILVSMTLVGSLAWLCFTVIGLRFTVTLAVAAGVGEIIPVLGPSSVFLAAFLIASTQDSQVMWGVVIIWLLIQSLETYVVIPIVMRRAVNLPPLVTLFTLVLWARLLGFGGLLLALPLNLVTWSLLEQFVIARHQTRPPQ